MMFALELAREAPCKLTKRFFEAVALEAIGRSGLVTDDVTVILSVALVSPEEIGELNRRYRRKNRPTDVLSFGIFRRKDDIVPDADGTLVLGELVLCPSFIEDAAKEDKVALEQEMAYIFSHGVFHLLGFRHCPRMFRLQDEIASTYATSGKNKK